MAYEKHISVGRGLSARCAVVTLSDTRTAENDHSGDRIATLLVEAGHEATIRKIIPDEPAALQALLELLRKGDTLDLIITNGGTGVSGRDSTVPVVERMLTTTLPGFGELFRMLSFEQIGSGAMLSRAVGGLAGRVLIFALPGSTKACELAMQRLILPEIGHLIGEIRKTGG